MIKMTLAALLLAGATTMALADSNKPAPAGSLSPAQITQKLQSQGYTVSKIKYKDGEYKVKATDANHHKAKLELNASTGEVIKGKSDTSKTEASKSDTSNAAVSKTDASKTDTSKTEASKTDTSNAAASNAQASKTDTAKDNTNKN
jgi:hypothetical protein